MREVVGDSDMLGRYGGEEFMLLTPEDESAAMMLAERLRQAVCQEPVNTEAGPLPVTITVGMAYTDTDEQDLGQLLARADTALCEAKRSGRNRVKTTTGSSTAID